MSGDTPHEGLERPLGMTVVAVREMTGSEGETVGLDEWYFTVGRGAPLVLDVGGGSFLYAMRDPEGNGPGFIVGAAALSGKVISHLESIPRAALARRGWGGRMGDVPTVLAFTDGTKAIIQCDPEGNGPGVLCFYDAGERAAFILMVGEG